MQGGDEAKGVVSWKDHRPDPGTGCTQGVRRSRDQRPGVSVGLQHCSRGVGGRGGLSTPEQQAQPVKTSREDLSVEGAFMKTSEERKTKVTLVL